MAPRWTAFLFIAILLFGFTVASATPVGIVSQCANTSVTEGNPGIVNCTVTNFLSDPILILDEFAFSYVISGDGSDNILSVDVIGPNPPGGNPAVFQVLFTTPPAETEAHPDFGLNDVSLILFAVDAIDPTIFVPGLYGSAAVSVFDTGLTPVTPTDTAPSIPINSPTDFDTTVSDAESRGYVTSTPEPAVDLLLAGGLLGLIGLYRWDRA